MNSESRRFYAVGVLAYLGLLSAGVVIVLGVLHLGNQWGLDDATSTETHSVPKSSSSVDVVFHVLFTLAAVIFLGAIFGRLCRYFGQPPVIGEVIAGLSLGPSLLGAISPDAMHLLIPSQVLDPKSAVATSLKVIAQLGVILYMFLVGLELNAAQLKHKAHAAVAISHASIVVPFTLGTILSLWLYPMLSDPDVPFVSFALFLGVAMSITASPYRTLFAKCLFIWAALSVCLVIVYGVSCKLRYSVTAETRRSILDKDAEALPVNQVQFIRCPNWLVNAVNKRPDAASSGSRVSTLGQNNGRKRTTFAHAGREWTDWRFLQVGGVSRHRPRSA